jgi:pSer/pThr/pTyr-binding forkhead associated (FHA) protein
MKQAPTIVVQLVHIVGPLKGEIQEFSGDVISIGRHPSCSVHFPADLVGISRKHADILREGNLFKLVDHSTNGTLVNGKPVKEPLILKDGDTLEFSPGGPKASFLTKIVEKGAEPEMVQPRREEPPQPRPEPVVQEIPPAPVASARPVEPVMEPPKAVPVQKITVPLIIQFGPKICSFKELPVTMGSSKICDFVIELPAIAEQHAQILFSQGQYWIKDLTGQGVIRVNGRNIGLSAALNPNDQLSLAPQGPVFEFLGEGRLAEVSEPAPEAPPAELEQKGGKSDQQVAAEKQSGGIWSILKKNI